MSRTVVQVLNQLSERDVNSYDDPAEAVAHSFVDKMWKEMFKGNFTENASEVWHKHHEMVRNLVPKENLLEYSVKEGWNPLCEFLNVPVPNEPFPRLNDPEAFAEKAKQIGFEIAKED